MQHSSMKNHTSRNLSDLNQSEMQNKSKSKLETLLMGAKTYTGRNGGVSSNSQDPYAKSINGAGNKQY